MLNIDLVAGARGSPAQAHVPLFSILSQTSLVESGVRHAVLEVGVVPTLFETLGNAAKPLVLRGVPLPVEPSGDFLADEMPRLLLSLLLKVFKVGLGRSLAPRFRGINDDLRKERDLRLV